MRPCSSCYELFDPSKDRCPNCGAANNGISTNRARNRHSIAVPDRTETHMETLHKPNRQADQKPSAVHRSLSGEGTANNAHTLQNHRGGKLSDDKMQNPFQQTRNEPINKNRFPQTTGKPIHGETDLGNGVRHDNRQNNKPFEMINSEQISTLRNNSKPLVKPKPSSIPRSKSVENVFRETAMSTFDNTGFARESIQEPKFCPKPNGLAVGFIGTNNKNLPQAEPPRSIENNINPQQPSIQAMEEKHTGFAREPIQEPQFRPKPNELAEGFIATNNRNLPQAEPPRSVGNNITPQPSIQAIKEKYTGFAREPIQEPQFRPKPNELAEGFIGTNNGNLPQAEPPRSIGNNINPQPSIQAIKERQIPNPTNETTITGSKANAVIVAAIDFGTTFSGYAYSFRNEYKKDPTKIYMNINWITDNNFVSEKTKTCILFRKDGSFDRFGFDAETKFVELMEEDKHHDYIFFDKFKMKLFKHEDDRRKFKKNMMLSDGRGNRMEALKVFAASIQYMVNHFKTCCRVQHLNIQNWDVHWVLTIPAIWSDEAKQFMRQAAEMAGIPEDLLTLAYEPEAAALCCKEMIVQRSQGLEHCSLETFSVGQRFIVLDCGGGTVDVTCYEVMSGWCLRELIHPTGGPWGGTVVDEEFMHMLENIFGETAWQEFQNNYPADFLELRQKFEAKKKKVSSDITIAFPQSLKTSKPAFQTSLNKSRYSSTIRSIKEKLRFDRDLIITLFDRTVNDILNHLEILLTRVENIHTVLMVGGFSQSDLLYQRVKEAFPSQNVICPPEAVLAVVKGAVMYGQDPSLVKERKCPRTYGICTNIPFDARKHPQHLRAVIDGEEKCTDIFKPLVTIGETLLVGKTIRYIQCHPANAYDSIATVEVYSSMSNNPKYTFNDDVKCLGTLSAPIPNVNSGKNRIITVQMEFGLTEIVVSAQEEETKKTTKATFKCI